MTGHVWSQKSMQWGLQGKSEHLTDITELAIMENGDAAFIGGHDSLVTFGKYQFRGPKHGSSSGATRTSLYAGRVSAQKKIRWMLQVATGTHGVYPADMHLDGQNNLWIIASCEGTIKFADGHTENQSGMGMLLAKVSPEGQLIWGRTYSGLGTHVHMYQVLPRSDGKCYVLGNHGHGTFGDSKIPGGGSGQYSQYIGLVDSQGTPLWGKSIGGPGGKITANDVTFDENENLIISGNYRYINTPKVIDESGGVKASNVTPETQLGAGNVGSAVTSIGSSSGSVQAFIGRYDRDTGEPIEVHAYGGESMSNASAIAYDADGSMYVSFGLYGPITIKGKTIPVKKKPNTMVMAKLSKDWELVWYRIFDNSQAAHGRDLCIDGRYIYLACMTSKGKLKVDDVTLTTKGLWSGVALKFDKTTGRCVWGDEWQVGSGTCIDMKDNTGYIGGWFHYETKIGKDNLKVGQDGQFNAVLIGYEPPEEEEDTLTDPPLTEPVATIEPEPEPEPVLTKEERKIESQHVIEVTSREIEIQLWDDQRIDGDIISIRYDGKWILDHFELSGSPKTIKIQVKTDGPGYFEMFSEDVGSIPPTTTAVKIIDGKQTHKLALRSTPKSNGAIEIRLKE